MFKNLIKSAMKYCNAVAIVLATINRQNKEKNDIFKALGSPRFIGLNQHESTLAAIAEMRGHAKGDTLNQPMIDLVRETLVEATKEKAGLK